MQVLRNIVMTVKPRHIRNMRKGIKKYEMRKTRPVYRPHGEFRKIWLCESGSGGRIVASFRCRAYPRLTDRSDETIAKVCAITPEEVRGYRKKGDSLYGWLIEDFEYFHGPENNRHIVDFGLERPPQSWCYVKGVGGDE